jgi:hypothetical protein
MTSSQLLAGPYDVFLAACGRQQAAMDILSCGAKVRTHESPFLVFLFNLFPLQFEEDLRNFDDVGQADNHAKASAILTYYIGIYPVLSWNSGVSCCRGSQGEWMPYV